MESKKLVREIPVNKYATVYEFVPGYRSMVYDGERYCLPFPYVVFVIRTTGKIKTLHVGCRTEPLDEKSLKDQELLYPPLSNIYMRWLLACSRPSIAAFWSSPFMGGWPEAMLVEQTALESHEHWQRMTPEEVMKVFAAWPKTIEFPHDPVGGLWCGGTTSKKDLPVRVTMTEVLAPMSREALNHVGNLY